ncbi:hypothetical protein ABZ137_29310 [Streptomyces bobili]|uniref:hypothetical protein n=1 Tax=Streptomyces bobili TaxID=67280 RepID=UPI0033B9FF5B
MTPIVEAHRIHGRYAGRSAGRSDVHADCRRPMPARRCTPAFRPGRRDAASGRRRTVDSASDERCRNLIPAPVAAQFPPVAGEIGENSCSRGFVDQVMKWSDDRGLSYLVRTWNTRDCSTGPSLTSTTRGHPPRTASGRVNISAP